MKTLRVLATGILLVGLSACVTESDRPSTGKGESNKSPVEQVQETAAERIEKMKFQYGSDLLATMQGLIGLKDLARGPVVEALPNADPRTRANLLYVLGFIGGSDSHRAITPYLGDRDLMVRYEAAAALLQIGDWSSVPTLIEFLGNDDRRIRYKSFQILREKTRLDFGYDFNGAPHDREEALGRWKNWWQDRRREIIIGRN